MYARARWVGRGEAGRDLRVMARHVGRLDTLASRSGLFTCGFRVLSGSVGRGTGKRRGRDNVFAVGFGSKSVALVERAIW